MDLVYNILAFIVILNSLMMLPVLFYIRSVFNKKIYDLEIQILSPWKNRKSYEERLSYVENLSKTQMLMLKDDLKRLSEISKKLGLPE